jgi:ADP-ribose pyrophosphatase YjhB (NUDIX family)
MRPLRFCDTIPARILLYLGDSRMPPTPRWLEWSRRLQAIAQTGLAYTQGDYDRQRYDSIIQIAAEIAADQTDADSAMLVNLFSQGQGYATPKVDVRAAVFRDDSILLVKERADGLWTLPGGWADVGDSPSAMVVREVREESGYDVCAVRLLAVYDRDHPRHNHTPYPFHCYKLFFQCDLLGGAPATSIETDGA